MSENKEQQSSKWPLMTIVGMILFAAAIITLFVSPKSLDEGFMAMVARAHPIVINVGILSIVFSILTAGFIAIVLGGLLIA